MGDSSPNSVVKILGLMEFIGFAIVYMCANLQGCTALQSGGIYLSVANVGSAFILQ